MNTFGLFSKIVSVDIDNKINFSETEKKKLKKLVLKQDYRKNEKDITLLSSKSFHILDELPSIKTKFENYFNNFNDVYLKYDNKFKLSTVWSTKSSHLSYCEFHNHSNHFYSGVYYVDVDDDCGEIEFCDFTPCTFELSVREYNYNNLKSWRIKPKNNMILLFPSQMHHKVHVNNSKKDRYSIALNFFPVGKIGIGDTQIDIGKL